MKCPSLCMDNKKQYRQLLCFAQIVLNSVSEKTEVFPPRIISFSTALTEN